MTRLCHISKPALISCIFFFLPTFPSSLSFPLFLTIQFFPMDFEDGDYLEQRNTISDDSTDEDHSGYSKPPLSNYTKQLLSLFRHDQPKQRQMHQREPTMSSSCSPKPIPNPRQRKTISTLPLTPPKRGAHSPPSSPPVGRVVSPQPTNQLTTLVS